MAEIELEDTGRGIARRIRSVSFSYFYDEAREEAESDSPAPFETVQLLNGSIDFKSEVGRGTTFRIELPLARQMEPALPRPRDAGAAAIRNA